MYAIMSASAKKRSYDAAFKLAAVKDAEKTTNRGAAKISLFMTCIQ